jgi:TonB family protein
MNRLQKKCVIATASFHLLLLVILFVGPAFFWSREKPDTSPVLEMISSVSIDTASTGVQSPQPPPPAPPVIPQPPTPPQPQVITPPAPQPEPVKPDLMPVVKPDAVKPTPKISLVPVIHNVPKTSATPAKPTPDNSKAINSALTALRNNLSHATQIAPVGNDSAAASNYAQVVKSIYEQAWILPDDMTSDTANTKVRVTISSDGTVVSAKIITPSGEAKLDASVQRTLERVQVIEPFPPGSTDTERTYIINFNPQIKRMLG